MTTTTAPATSAPERTTSPPPAAPETAATYDIDAERIVLGAMLIDRNTIGDITDILTPTDFYRPDHTTIYHALTNRYATGNPTDPTGITAHLLATGELARIGGAPYLHQLVATVPLTANGRWYAHTIREHAARRRLADAAIRIAAAAASPALNLAEAQDRAGSELHAAIVTRIEGEPARAGDLITTAFDRIEAASKQKGIRGLTTGLIDLDKLTGGLQPGRMYVVAGRPGMGKTVAAFDMVRANALHADVPCLFVTLEMSRDEVMDRLLAAETRTAHHAIQEGRLNDADWTRLGHKATEIADKPLFIDDTPVNLAQLSARARRIQQRHGLGLLVVDYLQLMPSMAGGSKDKNREREVAELSRGLKLLGKELNIPIIAVSQLNRAADSRTDKRPTMADLRESGAVEQDADVVILLYRPDYYEKECPRSGEADFIVAKNRHGPTDTITVAAQLHLMRFADMSIDATN